MEAAVDQGPSDRTLERRTLAYIGIGANLGDARGTLLASIREMSLLPSSRVIAVSSFYETSPVDASGPNFINAVVALETGLEAAALLEGLQGIEAAHGRERPFVNAPRTLDLDILIFGDLRSDTPALTVPHPRLHQRAFALEPLLEISPDAVIAGLGRAANVLAALRARTDQHVTRL